MKLHAFNCTVFLPCDSVILTCTSVRLFCEVYLKMLISIRWLCAHLLLINRHCLYPEITTCLALPCLAFGVGRLLHLPSAEAVSVRPNARPQK